MLSRHTECAYYFGGQLRERATEMQVEVVKPRHRNPADGQGGPNHWEVWLRDPEGYAVVLASPDGSACGEWKG